MDLGGEFCLGLWSGYHLVSALTLATIIANSDAWLSRGAAKQLAIVRQVPGHAEDDQLFREEAGKSDRVAVDLVRSKTRI